jgi:adenylate kinase family enzyme
MKKIMIVGFSGSGKSTLARQLGEKLNIVPTHMDALYWKPGWAESSTEEHIEKLKPILQRDEWVIEGSYRRVLYRERLHDADTVIFLDMNRFLCFYRVIKRRILYRGRTRPDMGEGCPEKLDFEFAKWVLWDGRKKRWKLYEDIRLCREMGKDVWIAKRPKQVRKFLENVEGQR